MPALSASQISGLLESLGDHVIAKPDSRASQFLHEVAGESCQMTHGQLHRAARALATALQQHDAVPGQPVLLLLPPGAAFLCAYFACLYAGMVPVAVPPAHPQRGLKNQQLLIAASGYRHILSTNELHAQTRLATDVAGRHWLCVPEHDSVTGGVEPGRHAAIHALAPKKEAIESIWAAFLKPVQMNQVFASALLERDGKNAFPLSSVQQVVWLDQILHPQAPIYNIGLAWKISGPVDSTLLQRAINSVANRHESFRMLLSAHDELARQSYLKQVNIALPVHDFSAQADADQAARAHMHQAFSQPFDLKDGLLWESQLVISGSACHYWLLRHHHLMTDGFGLALIVHAVADAYNTLLAQNEPAEAGASYIDFIAEDQDYLASPRFERDREYWYQRYQKLPDPLFTLKNRENEENVLPSGQVDWVVSRAHWNRLNQFATGHGYSIMHLIMTGIAACYARLNQNDQIIIGVPVHNRSTARQKQTIGMFSSISPIGIRIDRSLSFTGLMGEVAAELRRSYRHQRFPVAEINRSLKLGQASRQQLYEITLSSMSFSGDDHFGGAPTHVEPMNHGHERVPLAIAIRDHHALEDVLVEFVFNPRYLKAGEVARIRDRIALLIDSALEHPERPLTHLSMLSSKEYKQVVHDFNDNAVPFPSDKLLQQLFEEQVERTPEVVALEFEDATMSYAELNRRANQLAHRLIAFGAQPESRVAVGLDRSMEMIISLLAVLKAGCAYVPLDPSYPMDRLTYMLADSSPVAIISTAALHDSMPESTLPRLLLDEAATLADLADRPRHNPDPRQLGLSPDNLAYVLYTSGSTGQPKGVMNEHRGLVNCFTWMQKTFPMGSDDRILQKTPYSFDISGLEIYGSLLYGARLVIAAPGGHRLPKYLEQVMFEKNITVVHFVPAMMQVFIDQCPNWRHQGLRHLMLAGEAVPPQLVERLHRHFPGMNIHNLYGPTEAAIIVTWHACTPRVWGNTVPIGTPFDNTGIYILDQHNNPLPVGIPGEIHIGGVQVARGYMNRAEQTAERFIHDPFSSTPGAKMYKTGDLGRWRKDGSIECLGRNDFQVKIRGFRIELGEIEARLKACPGVHDAVVLAREDNPGEKRLVAYLIEDEGSDLAITALRQQLAENLAEYMIPAAFVKLDKFPVNTAGKIDRKALPAPDQTALATRQYEAPRGELENTIAILWQNLLGLERIGRQDHFIELGGHSLLALQLVGKIHNELNIEVTLRDLFYHPTLAEFAEVARNARETMLGAIMPIDRKQALPLSFSQQRLWFVDQLDHGEGSAYHMPAALDMQGELNRAALQAALDGVMARHEALRTTFVEVDGQPIQRFAPANCGFALSDTDLTTLPVAEREQRVAQMTQEEAAAPFDLATGPLIRAQLLHLGPNRWRLLVTQHHIISDGWSIGILLREISTLYAAFCQNQPNPLPPLAIQYADYAHWQRNWLQGEVLEQQLAYWGAQLAGLPVAHSVPFDHPRPRLQTFAGAVHREHIDATTHGALTSLCQQAGATSFMGLYSAFAVLLARTSNETDIVVGCPIANREQAQVANLIGFFVNTLILRSDLSGSPSFMQLLGQSKRMLLDAYAHQQVPFEQLVERLQPQRVLNHSPLFQIMLVMQTHETADLALPGLTLTPAPNQFERHTFAKFDLTLTVEESAAGMALSWEYNTGLFEPDTIARLSGHFCTLMKALVAQPEAGVYQAEMLLPAERTQLLHQWNATAHDFPRERCIHEFFEEQVVRQPDAVAVVFEHQSLSYRELNRRANQLAHFLVHEKGVKPDALVGICIERSLAMVVAIVAILKAGGAYVPLDPDYPTARLAYMLEDANLTTVLTHRHLLETTPVKPAQALCLDDPSVLQMLANQTTSNIPLGRLGLTSHHLAYVIYTSGSTGNPKGVMNEHRGLVNRIDWMHRHYGCCPDDRILQKTPFSFDVSVWEFVWPLLAGARIVLAKPEGHKDPQYLTQLIGEQGITKLHFVPSMLGSMLSIGDLAACHSLRQVFCSGEALALNHVAQFQAKCPWAQLHNLYGPTEAAIDVSYFDCALTHEGLTSVPIGKPISNIQLHVMTDDLVQGGSGALAPQGVAAELHIGGIGLARGYLNRPELTAEKFIANPFHDASDPASSERLYKTGDLVRWMRDGNLEYLGRIDHQVKIRGFRIELGEIEFALSQQPGIKETVVLAKTMADGDKRLVAYCVTDGERASDHAAPASVHAADAIDAVDADNTPASHMAGPEASALTDTEQHHHPLVNIHDGSEAAQLARAAIVERLRQNLAASLPGHMVPAAFVLLEKMPVTPNGKADRKALPDPDFQQAQTAYLAPSTDTEVRLCEIWQDVLGIERVGVHDNFFQLGGHSLLAVQLMSRIRTQFGVEMSLRDLFTHPTLIQLAGELGKARQSEQSKIEAAPRTGALPLSFAQQRLWFINQLDAVAGSAYHMPAALQLQGRLNRNALKATLDQIVRRHEILRTRFVQQGGSPVQLIDAPDTGFALQLHDLSALPAAERALQLRAMSHAEAMEPFNLSTGPLIRGQLLQTGPDSWQLLVTQHHIISDGWSIGILIKEITALYSAFCLNQTDPLPPLAIQYADYAQWQRQWLQGPVLDAQTAHWKQQLAGAPNLLDLPLDRTRPQVQTYDGAALAFTLEPDLAAALHRLTQRHGTTLFMTMLAGFAVLMSRLSSQQDVVIGTPVANRLRTEVEPLIGFFVNTLALRVKLDHNPQVAQLLEQVKATTLAAYEHQDVPFEQVVEALQPPRSLSYSPLFQVMLSVNNTPGKKLLQLPGLSVKLQEPENNIAHFDLILTIEESGLEVSGDFHYNTALFDAASIERMGQQLRMILRGMVANEAQTVNNLPLLGNDERERVIRGFNQTDCIWPENATIPALFEEQAARVPNATAVFWQAQSITYAELNRRANQLAHQLRALGVKADDRVAICMERSVEMVVGLLAILKAGGGYVPLDPAYPLERQSYMLADCQPAALISTAALTTTVADKLAEAAIAAGVPLVLLDKDAAAIAAHPASNLPLAEQGQLGPHHLAYVIYTSGSTGQPKGLMVEHRNVVQLVRNNPFAPISETSCFAHCASPSFDASTWEIWGPLLNGGKVLVVPQNVLLDPPRFASNLLEAGVSHLFLTIALLNQYVEAMTPLWQQLQYLLFGGEKIDLRKLGRTFAKGGPHHLLHVYGPTETTTFATYYEIRNMDGETRSLPIGRPLGNARAYILDASLQPQPIGVAGEIWLGGAGVARGYLNQPGMSAERFVTDPFSEKSQARMYKTGDLARWLPSGDIEYIGRTDFQVKIRGFRIEPGEIEARLVTCPGVREAVVLVREDTPGDKRLIAYLVAHDGATLSVADIRHELASNLAEYMVPSSMLVLPQFPLTTNGKVDRKALPVPDAAALSSTEYVAPEGEVESLIATLWQELLGSKRVGRMDHFFELGGHSLLAVQLVGRLREVCHVDIALKQLFENPTLSQLAALVTSLQFTTFLGADAEQMRSELDGLSEEELLAMLAAEDEDD